MGCGDDAWDGGKGGDARDGGKGGEYMHDNVNDGVACLKNLYLHS